MPKTKLSEKQKAAVFAYRTLANQPRSMSVETIEELDRIRDDLLDTYSLEICALCLEFRHTSVVDEDGFCPDCKSDG